VRNAYYINKGIGQPVRFKGLVGQYIWWLGGALVGLLVLFAIMYLARVPLGACLIVVLVFGTLAFVIVSRFSRQYGEYGWMKKTAVKYIPKQVKGNLFT
jgi:hypothetical protein